MHYCKHGKAYDEFCWRCAFEGKFKPKGQIAIWFLYALIPILAMVCLTLNIMLLTIAKERLQSATDASAIAGACYLPDGDAAQTAAAAYLRLNDGAAHIVSVSINGSSVTVIAAANVNALGAATIAARAIATAYPVGSLHRARLEE